MTTQPKPTFYNWTRIGFTGHRDLGSHSTLVNEKINEVISNLNQRYGALVGVSSVAIGADTLFLQALNQQQIPFQLVFPLSKDDFRQDFSASDWQVAESLMTQAYYETEVPKTEMRNAAYYEAGMITAEKSDLLVAVWDGLPAKGTGGTADVVAFARARKMPLVIIDAASGDVIEENIDAIAHLNNTDTNSKPSSKPEDIKGLVKRAYDRFDEQATKHGLSARYMVVLIILLHLIATLVAIGGKFIGPWAYTSEIKLVALVAAVYFVWRHHTFQHSWVEARPSAEVCRLFLAIWPLKRADNLLDQSIFDGQTQLIRNLITAWRLDKDAALPLEAAKQGYLKNRVGDQIVYYKNQYQKSAHYYDVTRYFANVFTGLSILCASFVMFKKQLIGLSGDAETIIAITKYAKFASVIFPLITAAILSMMLATDFGRRSKRYREMVDLLLNANTNISAAKTWPSLWRAVNSLEQSLFNEIEEWQSLTVYTGESH